MTQFDRIIDRRGTGALKTDALAERYGRPDLDAFWVADMDFATPAFITRALRRALADGSVLGYMVENPDFRPAVARWTAEHHGWDLRLEWISFIPGIVKGIGLAINALTAPGDGVIIQPPVYHIFRGVIEGNGRRVVNNPLRERPDGLYDMDLDGLERLAPQAKMLILSNPHNPGGVVWPADTLRRVADIAARHGLTVISDEIHADMVFEPHRHVPFASVSPEAAACSITFGAPTKTFNMPGIVSAWSAVPDAGLRARFHGWLDANELSEAPTLSAIAAVTAYSAEGDAWRRRMLRYVSANIDELERLCAERFGSRVRVVRPEASFLAWLDCRGLGLEHDRLVDLFVNGARLALNSGAMFGPGGEGHMRMNVAVPRARLASAINALADAVLMHNA